MSGSVAIALALLAIASSPARASNKKPLYYRMGGKAVLASAVNDFVDRLDNDARLMANPQIKQLRPRVSKKAFKKKLTDRLCETTGGPCRSGGPLVPGGPEKITLTPSEWLFLLQDLNASLKKSRIPRAEQAELVSLMLKNRNQ